MDVYDNYLFIYISIYLYISNYLSIYLSLYLDKYGPQKAMEVCEICGAFLVVGDPNAKLGTKTYSSNYLPFYLSILLYINPSNSHIFYFYYLSVCH